METIWDHASSSCPQRAASETQTVHSRHSTPRRAHKRYTDAQDDIGIQNGRRSPKEIHWDQAFSAGVPSCDVRGATRAVCARLRRAQANAIPARQDRADKLETIPGGSRNREPCGAARDPESPRQTREPTPPWTELAAARSGQSID